MRLFVVRIRRLGVDMDESIDQIGIEVAFALPDRQVIKYLAVPAGTTARQAVELSGIEAEFEAFALTTLPLGIFSEPVSDTQVLRAGDRVEIYRPLLLDPKEIRKIRAEKVQSARSKNH
jgi:uncharacterized protein